MSNSVLGIVIVNSNGGDVKDSISALEHNRHILCEYVNRLSTYHNSDQQMIKWIEVIDNSSVEDGFDKRSMELVREIVDSGFVKFLLRNSLHRHLRDSSYNLEFVQMLKNR